MKLEEQNELKEMYKAIIYIATKRRDCVGVEQGGGRVPLVPMYELSLFTGRDFEWLAHESHHVINAAMKWLKEQDGYEEMIADLKEGDTP